jgi:hypothetical protein
MMKRIRKISIILISSLLGACVFLAATFAVMNTQLPQKSANTEVLTEADKIRLLETLHLRQKLGNKVWPGWGNADIPMIAYNEAYVFLTGYPDPPEGWVKVPIGTQYGGPWELVPGDTFNGDTYYRQPLPDENTTPEAFTVLIGDRWVSSLQTYDWAKISLLKTIRSDLPPFLRPIFPYQLFIQQLVSGSDQYNTLIAHETFHAFQGQVVPQKLAAAENMNQRYEQYYPWDDAALQAGWQNELNVLAEALRTTDRAETLQLAARFLEIRTARRETAQINVSLIAYEQHREWIEGLARYVELEVWRQAADSSYSPIPETSELADFNEYEGFKSRWSKELNQIPMMADDEGDGRFYYSGMAQAFLLDRLLPDWKDRVFDNDIWLEDMLRDAVANN